MPLNEEIGQQFVHLPGAGGDLPVLPRVRPRCGELEPVQRALAGERRAVLPPRLEAPENGSDHRILPQLVMVVQILIAEQEAEYPLPRHAAAAVHRQIRVPGVAEAVCEPVEQVQPPLGEVNEQSSGVRGQRSAGEIGLDAGL